MNLSCIVRPPLTIETAPDRICKLTASDTVLGGSASGSFAFEQKGKRNSLSFDVQWSKDSSFTAAFSTILGMNVATIDGKNPAQWIVQYADTQVIVHPLDMISASAALPPIPFTWREFFLFVTQMHACRRVALLPYDSSFVDKKNIRLFWNRRLCEGRSMAIVAILDNKTQQLAEIVYKPDTGVTWSIRESAFFGGYAKEITGELSHNNYFYISYSSMKIESPHGRRKAF